MFLCITFFPLTFSLSIIIIPLLIIFFEFFSQIENKNIPVCPNIIFIKSIMFYSAGSNQLGCCCVVLRDLSEFFLGGRRDRASELMDDRRKSSTAVNYFNVARMRSGAVFAYPRGTHSAASCWSFFNPAAKKQTNARPTDDNQG